MPSNSWYRNAGSGRYHKARADWIRSGKAICGADISRPGYVINDIPVKGCGHCLTKEDNK